MSEQLPYTDEDIIQFLQSLDDLPSNESMPLLGYDVDPSYLSMNEYTQSSLSFFPSLPSLAESQASTPEVDEHEIPSDGLQMEGVKDYVKRLESEVNSLKSMVAELRSYLTSLRPWILEVTEALDKLGEPPASATESEFRMFES
ncbi:hypothetical protein BO82DRAFT_436965 [Aspergillus uvarum CBS 121591]|uniref:Uncharacterized protein n=2 Tax=Aspergillus subgen. Circumdati TaxID=2720871 RepID=A0A319BTT1_9EURO|nr:hypothetical protein BO82DRAFT_436965 [Aspergillus uvarum CBS 121591]XP_025533494.1 hypothetical protein BO86DRAFT_6637 [Aspergillus japonicus CBS 114.51]PYH75994.1 hypothetical protein BO82DRAFT_436965 [Aspergillus uvarum CBS 121591]RAH87600.1 hypothetical protein BO86DRAFT_6637 [Aspergillus japonicus CBS 114.51]